VSGSARAQGCGGQPLLDSRLTGSDCGAQDWAAEFGQDRLAEGTDRWADTFASDVAGGLLPARLVLVCRLVIRSLLTDRNPQRHAYSCHHHSWLERQSTAQCGRMPAPTPATCLQGLNWRQQDIWFLLLAGDVESWAEQFSGDQWASEFARAAGTAAGWGGPRTRQEGYQFAADNPYMDDADSFAKVSSNRAASQAPAACPEQLPLAAAVVQECAVVFTITSEASAVRIRPSHRSF
jgi:hypothetical protein